MSQFTPYDPYQSYDLAPYAPQGVQDRRRNSLAPTQSPVMSTFPAATYAPTYAPAPALHQPGAQEIDHHAYPGMPLVASREGASGPARQASVSRRDYSGPGAAGSSAAGHNSSTAGGRVPGPYARPLEPAPIRVRDHSGPNAVKASSTTSEFTKRKNWSQHIIDEIQDFMHVLAPDGNVIFAAPSIRDLTGWAAEEVMGRPISDFIHADDVESFLLDFDAALRDGTELNVYYRFRMKDERYTIFEIAGHGYFTNDEDSGERKGKCFFGMGRPYPSKNTAMLDTFLELKMENERLRQDLQVMYRDLEGGGSPFPPSHGSDRRAYPSPYSAGDALGHSPPQGYSGVDSITGLAHSSSSAYGSLGIGITQTAAKSDPVPGEKKKKKPRVEEGDLVCRDCGTVDSPEWRKGPEGPKSLCNACGLRYAKLRSKDKLKGGIK